VVLGFVLIATSTRTESSQRAEPNTIAFVHVAVIDATGAPTKLDQTVLISGDRITAVAPFARTPIPKGTRAIDATGKFLIPGLWDAHVHTRYQGIDHLRLLVAHGITSTRNMSAPWDHLSEVLVWQQQIAKGERIGPRLLTTGPVLDGPGSGRATNLVVNNADEGRQAVRQIETAGAAFLKVYDLLSRDAYFAIAAEAKLRKLPFDGHVPFAVSAGEASDAGQRAIEHLEGILWSSSDQEDKIREAARNFRPSPETPGAVPVTARQLYDSFSVTKLRSLANRLKANQTVVVPTLSVYKNRFESREDGSPVKAPERLQYVPAGYVERWKSQQYPSPAEDARLQFLQVLTVVKELHNAGVMLLAGTDVGISYQIPGISLHDELSLLVQAGLSPMDALESATRNPARTFKLLDQGTIEKGMRADLVLLDASPLNNIENVRKIRAVVARGRVFDRNELDALLADIQRAASQWAGTPTR
jgi:hypothetical protein